MLQKQIDSIRINFTEYLSNLGISPKSHKNYRSDISHFTEWVILKLRSFGSYVESLSDAVPFLSPDLAKEYKNYMIENKVPGKTINRRLSTLRHLSKFLFSSHSTDFDFTDGLENISFSKNKKQSLTPIITDFQSYLEGQKVSKNTVKNYVSDIRQFLVWMESNGQTLNSSN